MTTRTFTLLVIVTVFLRSRDGFIAHGAASRFMTTKKSGKEDVVCLLLDESWPYPCFSITSDRPVDF